MEKVDAWQVFWSILIVLGGYISVMITLFRKEVNKLREEIEEKVSTIDCKITRKECEEDCNRSRQERARFLHQHASQGQAGEVIK
jgi:hypothetical protein